MKVWLALLATLPLLAVGSGATASPSAPPQNGLIAVSGSDGLYVVDPQTRTARLIPKSENLTDAEWSPDGTLLAVTSKDPDAAGVSDVYTMKPDGSDRTLVLRNASQPSWSPDGQQLVVLRHEACAAPTCDSDGSYAAVVGLDGSKARPIMPVDSVTTSPEWSPDGKSIAVVGSKGVMIIRPEGVGPIRTFADAGASLSWSPDSLQLALDRSDDLTPGGREVVVLLDLASGQQTVLHGEQQGAALPTWSPEGNELAFISMLPDAKAGSPCGPFVTSQLWVMAPDGTNAHQLVKGSFSGPPSWARATYQPAVATPPLPIDATPVTATGPKPAPIPSSKPQAKPATSVAARKAKPSIGAESRIAVRGEKGIYLVDPATGHARKVPGTIDMSAPAWSPDMRLLAVEKAEKSGTSVYTIRPDGTHPQLVMKDASAPSWSANGERVVAVHGAVAAAPDSEDDAAQVLYSARLDGTDLQRVDFENDDAYLARALAWPTDGLASHFFDEESLIGPGNFDSGAATWSPDGTVLAFTDVKTGTGLWVVSANGGKPELVLAGASGRPFWGATPRAAGSARR